MSKVLTIDDDLADLLDLEVSRSGEPLNETVSRLLRSSLQQSRQPAPNHRFRVRGAKDLGLPPEWTSGKVEDLLDLLEGPERHC